MKKIRRMVTESNGKSESTHFCDTVGEVLVFLRRIFWKTLFEAVMM